MFYLNEDVLYLVLKELEDDRKTLYLCLTVNKTWCEIIIPILWKNPWKYLKGNQQKKKLLFINIIISHLSDASRNNLKSLKVDILTNSYTKPLFNYVSFCKYLNLRNLNEMFNIINHNNDVKKEIYNLFINENTRLTHLYIPNQFDYPIHLIPGANLCFSNLKFLSCNTSINDNVLSGLTEMCKSIKEIELVVKEDNNNYGIIKLIEATKKLFNVRLLVDSYYKYDELFCKVLENSLNKHSNFIRHFYITKQPVTKIISSLVNLNRLELKIYGGTNMTWNYLENLSLPFLQILKAQRIPVEAIYRNCPNLKYLKLLFRNSNILELENLLINCQGLILTKSSPISLFKIKLQFDEAPTLESLKIFFDNWKDRHSLSLQTLQVNSDGVNLLNWDYRYLDLVDECKTNGIIKKYKHDVWTFQGF
ncbi:19368_t:CDS:2 [Rhizophagus irregularis]|nr:19368_t:CDS:2 [Rhizophagus irregularis]